MYMMAYAAQLLANAVHESEAPEAHDGLCSILVANAVHLSEVPDVHDFINYTVHLLAIAVH